MPRGKGGCPEAQPTAGIPLWTKRETALSARPELRAVVDVAYKTADENMHRLGFDARAHTCKTTDALPSPVDLQRGSAKGVNCCNLKILGRTQDSHVGICRKCMKSCKNFPQVFDVLVHLRHILASLRSLVRFSNTKFKWCKNML